MTGPLAATAQHKDLECWASCMTAMAAHALLRSSCFCLRAQGSAAEIQRLNEPMHAACCCQNVHRPKQHADFLSALPPATQIAVPCPRYPVLPAEIRVGLVLGLEQVCSSVDSTATAIYLNDTLISTSSRHLLVRTLTGKQDKAWRFGNLSQPVSA